MSIQTAIANTKSRASQWETWTWGLLNAVVIGGFTSIGSWLGMLAAHGGGMDVPVLNFKAMGVIFLSGAFVKFSAYMAQGLPNLTQTAETSFVRQTADGFTITQSSKIVTTTPVDPAQPK